MRKRKSRIFPVNKRAAAPARTGLTEISFWSNVSRVNQLPVAVVGLDHIRGLGRRRHHGRVLGPLREIGGELVLKSGCQFAHEMARRVTAARHENAVKLARGLQVGANDLVSNLANCGGLDVRALLFLPRGLAAALGVFLVSNLDTTPFASILVRTVPTVVGLTFTVLAICRSDFSGLAFNTFAISSCFCLVVRCRRWMLTEITYAAGSISFLNVVNFGVFPAAKQAR